MSTRRAKAGQEDQPSTTNATATTPEPATKRIGVSRSNGYTREAHKSVKCHECGKLMRAADLEKHVQAHTATFRRKPQQEQPPPPQTPSKSAKKQPSPAAAKVKPVKPMPKLIPIKKILPAKSANQPSAAPSVAELPKTTANSAKPTKSTATVKTTTTTTTTMTTAPKTPAKPEPRLSPEPKSKSPVQGREEDGEEEEEAEEGTEESTFPCRFCTEIFSTLRIRTRHILNCHSGENPYQCKFCDKSFLRSSSLNQHEVFHTKARPFKCNLCSASFRYHSNLYSHKFTHKKHGSLSCRVCGKVFRQSTSLWSHMQSHRGEKGGESWMTKLQEKYQSPVFSKLKMSGQGQELLEEQEEYNTPTFLTSQDMDMFYNMNHDDPTLNEEDGHNNENDDENENENVNVNLIKVKKEHDLFESGSDSEESEDEPDVKPPKPRVQVQGLVSGSGVQLLKSFSPKQPGGKPQQQHITMCPICFQSFPLSHLSSHMETHNENGLGSSEKPWKCNYCFKAYRKRFELVQHEYSHTGERPYSCVDCGNTFRYKSNWCRHKRLHNHYGKGTGIKTEANQSEMMDDDEHDGPEPEVELKEPATPWQLLTFKDDDDDEEDGENEVDDFDPSNSNLDPLSEAGRGVKGADAKQYFEMKYNLPDIIFDEVTILEDDGPFGPAPPQQLHISPNPWPSTKMRSHNNGVSTSSTTTTNNGSILRWSSLSSSVVSIQPKIANPAPVNVMSAATATIPRGGGAGSPPKLQLPCTLCHKVFGSRRYLNIHMRQHRGDRRVQCKLCLKVFAHRFSLSQHALVHTGEMPFSCEICDKKFRFKSNYTKHNRMYHPEMLGELMAADQLHQPQQRRRRQLSFERQQLVDQFLAQGGLHDDEGDDGQVVVDEEIDESQEITDEGQGQGQGSEDYDDADADDQVLKIDLVTSIMPAPADSELRSRLTSGTTVSHVDREPPKLVKTYGGSKTKAQVVVQVQGNGNAKNEATTIKTTIKSNTTTNNECKYCSQAFDNPSELRLHILSHELGLSYSLV